MTDFSKYESIPYLHLGNSIKTGIDCVNLCLYILRKECGINRNYTTKDFCSQTQEQWYNGILAHVEDPMNNFDLPEYGWVKVYSPQIYDVILMTIGSSNVRNHAAMYIGKDKILTTAINKLSYITNYGNFYKQFTNGIYRCKEFMKN